jgi:FkbM family methyltransferase
MFDYSQALRRLGNEVYKYAYPIYKPLYTVFKAFNDRSERVVVSRLLKPGDVVVDAGANIGVYTRFLAKRIGSQGMVHSFEPDQDNFHRLERTLQTANNVRLNQLAVSDRTGESILYVSDKLNVDHRTYPTENEPRTRVIVHSIRLDDYFRPGERVDLLKMDIQGFELHAFKGATRVLTDNPTIKLLFEFWPYGLKCAGNSGEELLEFLRDSRFQCFLVANGMLNPYLERGPYSGNFGDYFNLLAQRASPSPSSSLA